MELASQYAKKAGNISDKDYDLGGYQIYTTFDKNRETKLTDTVAKARKKAAEGRPEDAKDAHFGASSVASDGRILAVYGGPDHRTQGYNESNATTVPAGSAFQPFVYAAGLEHGIHKTRDGPPRRSPARRSTTATTRCPSRRPKARTGTAAARRRPPRTTAAGPTGGSPCAGARLSVNTPFMQLGMDTGLDVVRSHRRARRPAPLQLRGRRCPRCPLGSATPSAIRMASAYATFAAGGTHTEPYSVRRITRNGTKVALETPTATGRWAPRWPRRSTTHSRTPSAPPTRTTSRLADPVRPDRPLGQVTGKAGTAQDDTAAWYVGTAKSVSTAVVVYRIDLGKSLEPLPLKGVAGPADDSVPYGIWSGAMSPLG